MVEFNDRRPMSPEDEKAILRDHDRSRREQHKWGLCDHGCCGPCAERAGEAKTHTRHQCAMTGAHT